MKFNFRKIATALTSTAMVGSTVALAAAASFPAPFVENGSADVAVVYGNQLDLAAVTDISSSLNAVTTSGGSSAGSTPTGGDFVQLDKNSNRLNLGNAINGPFGSTVDDDDLEVLLADGEYTAEDSDDFSYEQKITLGGSVLSHFRDSDYEDLLGLSERTPVVGINVTDGSFVMNYSLDFLDQAESDVDSSGDLEDIEGSDIPLLGKVFYVSDAKNGSASGTLGQFTLLDSADNAILKEGETLTLSAGGVSYEVSIDFLSTSEVILNVNGETTNSLNEGETHKLSSGAYVGIRDILQRDVAGAVGSVDFSVGSGKLEITSGNDVKINDESVSDLKAWIYRGTNNAAAETIDKIEIEWKADDDLFITPDSEIELPGFGGIKFTMNELVRSDEEKITLENDGDDSVTLRAPVKDGNAEINILYANNSGEFVGIGKSPTELLATAADGDGYLMYRNKYGGSNFHEKVVVSYNTSNEGESYVLSFTTNEDTSAGRNETTIKNEISGETWSERKANDIFDIGDVQFTIAEVIDNSTDEWVNFTYSVSNGMSVNRIYTDGGLMINLPYAVVNSTSNTGGVINVTVDYVGNTAQSADSEFFSDAGHGFDTVTVAMRGENKDDDLISGTGFNFTVNDNSNNELQISQVDSSGSGGPAGLEMGDSNTYEAYIRDDVAPRIVHYTDPDQDYVEVYYPMGDSETYAEVFLTDLSSSTGSSSAGGLSIMDSELAGSSMASKNLIVVGGSCVNSIAASLLGVSDSTCGSAWTSATGTGAGEYVIQTFDSEWASGKVATLVAGWAQSDTANAANYLRTQNPTTDVGTKYTGTTATSATMSTL